MEYLLRFLSKEDYVRQLLAGQLNLYTAANYIMNYEFGRGDSTECRASKCEFLNIYTPILCTMLYTVEDDGVQTIKLDKRVIRDFCPQGGYVVVIKKHDLISHLMPLFINQKQKNHGEIVYDLDLDALPDHWFDKHGCSDDVIFHKCPELSYQHEYRFAFYDAGQTYYQLDAAEDEVPRKTSVEPFSEDVYVQALPCFADIDWKDDCYEFNLDDRNVVHNGNWREHHGVRNIDESCLFLNPRCISYYSCVQAKNKSGLLGVPSFLIRIKWDVPKLVGSRCPSGYLLQLEEQYCDCFDYSSTERCVKLWKVKDGRIIGGTSSEFDDDTFVDYCKDPKTAAMCFGVKGTYSVDKEVYWLPNSIEVNDPKLHIVDILSAPDEQNHNTKTISWGKAAKLRNSLSSYLILRRTLKVPFDCTDLDDFELLPISNCLTNHSDVEDFLSGSRANQRLTVSFLQKLAEWLQSEMAPKVSQHVLDDIKELINMRNDCRGSISC